MAQTLGVLRNWLASRLSHLVALVGLLALLVSVLAAPHAALTAASDTWSPFVLVTGLLLIGFVANEEGLFEAAAVHLARLPGGGRTLLVASMGLVAAVTAVLNLDTSVAFLTPILVRLARRREKDETPFLYGCVFMSNSLPCSCRDRTSPTCWCSRESACRATSSPVACFPGGSPQSP